MMSTSHEESNSDILRVLKFKQFEESCLYSLDCQYEHWRNNNFGNSTICLPEAVDVCDGAYIRSTDPEASDFGLMGYMRRENEINGFYSQAKVHAAFQKSTVGGVLIQCFDFTKLYHKLMLCGLPKEKAAVLKQMAGMQRNIFAD